MGKNFLIELIKFFSKQIFCINMLVILVQHLSVAILGKKYDLRVQNEMQNCVIISIGQN